MNSFFKAFSKTASGSIITMLLSSILIKFIAIISGPQGIAIFSLLRDFSKMLVLLFSISSNIAIVQGLSTNSIENKLCYINNAIKIVIINIIFMVVLYICLITVIKKYLFNTILEVDGITLSIILVSALFGSINVIYNSILNANRKLGQMALSQIFSAFVGSLCSLPILCFFPTNYMYASILVIINFSWFLINSYYIKKNNIKIEWYSSLFKPLEKENINHFIGFSFGSLITGIAGIITILYLRFFIEKNLGLMQLGIFDAAWTLGTIYIIFLLSSFGTYVLPKLSAIKDTNERDNFFNHVISMTMSLFLPILITMITFKNQFIYIFYSEKFYTSGDLLNILLMGDFFKVFSWILGMLFLAYNRMFAFVVLSLFWDISFLILVYFNLLEYSLIGIGYAYVITQVIYLFLILIVAHKYFVLKLNIKSILILLISLILIFIVFYFNKNSINFLVYFFSMIICLIILFYNIRKEKIK